MSPFYNLTLGNLHKVSICILDVAYMTHYYF